jgi:hypothetical protein
VNELVSINGSLEDEFLFATPLKKHVCAQSTMIDFQTSSWSVCLKFIYHYVTKFERKTQGRIPFLQKVENANFHKSDRPCHVYSSYKCPIGSTPLQFTVFCM